MNVSSSSSSQRPLILANHESVAPKLVAYYSVYWQQNQSNDFHDAETSFEINSCLYFQNPLEDEDEEIREDGCGYVINYPAHIHPDKNLQIYNFDRKRNSLSKSNDMPLNSKKY